MFWGSNFIVVFCTLAHLKKAHRKVVLREDKKTCSERKRNFYETFVCQLVSEKVVKVMVKEVSRRRLAKTVVKTMGFSRL